MKRKKTTFKAIRVAWHDAKAAGGWKSINERTKEQPVLIHSVGYLLHEDAKKLVLAQNLADTGSYADTIVIPVGWIKSRKYLNSDIVYE